MEIVREIGPIAHNTRRADAGPGMGAWPGRKTWSVIETALPRLFELRSFSLVGIALVPPKRWAHASIHVPLQTLVLRQQGRSNLQNRLGVLQQPRLLGPLDPVVELFDQGVIRCRFIFSEA